ncbi:glycosyltransferase family 39 protein [Piscinibacter sp.]|uniref:glycosyltransferase family 39 protein n=1 Tax=Piscinibacter sp. TaxID=1903157 RepID=UPI002F3F1DF7
MNQSAPTFDTRWTRPGRALGLLALWLLATLGVRPLLLPDEGRYATVARDMLLGDGLTPLLNGLPFFHKPPLMYWLDMAAMALLGVSQFSARVAPFVGAWVMGAALFLAVRRWHGARTAVAALLVLASCPFFFVGGQYANLDMLVGGLISATVLAFVRAVDDTKPTLRWITAAWALAALSVLAKGLIGLVLPALIVGPWLLVQGRWRDVLRLVHPLALLVFVAVALPWFALMQQRYPGFFDYIVIEQHFRRFAQTNFNNAQPAWFYLAVLPLLSLPWSGWLPRALRDAWRERAGPDRWRLALYAWWIVAVVGFFSLPASKLVGYVLPALAPWCVLIGTAAARHRRGFVATLAVSALVSLAAVAGLAWKAPHSSKPAAAVLAAQIAPGDRVVFVDEMFYDLPFYAGLKQPVIVASDWADPELPLRDNWRKELVDAARFDPARARELLWPLDRLGELGCHSQAVWFVLRPGAAARLATLPGIVTVHADRDVQLVRAPARRC